jgi:hypothetical protein
VHLQKGGERSQPIQNPEKVRLSATFLFDDLLEQSNRRCVPHLPNTQGSAGKYGMHPTVGYFSMTKNHSMKKG